jgi:hypothetical protein
MKDIFAVKARLHAIVDACHCIDENHIYIYEVQIYTDKFHRCSDGRQQCIDCPDISGAPARRQIVRDMFRYLLIISPLDYFVPRNDGDADAVDRGVRRR